MWQTARILFIPAFLLTLLVFILVFFFPDSVWEETLPIVVTSSLIVAGFSCSGFLLEAGDEPSSIHAVAAKLAGSLFAAGALVMSVIARWELDWLRFITVIIVFGFVFSMLVFVFYPRR